MPRKQRKVKEEDNVKEEEIHPDFTSDTVPDSPSNNSIHDENITSSDNLEPSVNDNIENSINETSDNSTNINYGDDESGAEDGKTSDNYDPGIVQEDEQTDDQESFEQDIGIGSSTDDDEQLTEEDLKNLVDKEGQDDDEEEQEDERPLPPSVITADQALYLDSDNNSNSSSLEELDAEHEYQRRLRVNDFLIEYAKGVNRSVDEVADKKGISSTQAREFLNTYINKVKETVLKQKYPDELIRYYNTGIKEDDKRIKKYHTDYLKPLVKKYAQYDINSNIERLNSNQSDKFISRDQVSSSGFEDNPLINSNSSVTQRVSQAPPLSSSGLEYNDVDHLFDGITSLQLIRFGLYNVFGQQARIKIGNMIGMNPSPYLTDEQKMRNLLIMATGSPQKSEYFIDWLKTNSRYVTQPEGFLRHQGGSGDMAQGGQGQGQGGLYGASPYYQNGHSNNSQQPDDMDLYYYQQGIYIKGFPPNHPINIQNLREYREEKANEKQLKAMDQRLRSAIQMKMLETFDSVGGNKNNSNSFLTPEMMFLMGMGRYRQSGTDETGKPVMVFEPSFGAFGGGGQGSGGTGSDSMTSMMGAFKEMVGFMSSIQNQNKSPDMMAQFMQVLMQKALQPESNRMEEVLKSFEVFQKLKGPEMPQMPGVNVDPEVAIKTKRMELDRDFGMKRLQLQEKELDLQRARLEQQDKEANQNLQTLLEGAGQVVPMVLNLAQQFFMGNRGGVMGGMQGGNPGMQPQPGGGGAPPGTNPAELILKMEYEKQKQQREEEAYRKRMEWEEELRRKNAEAAYSAHTQHPIQQQRETETVVIKEPSVQKQKHREIEPENYDESMFEEFPVDKLESIIKQVEKENRKMQKYKAAVETALQNKILNEDYNMFDNKQQQEMPTEQVITTTTKETTKVVEEEPQVKDFTEMLDETSYRDPDWDGTETEEVIIDEGENEEEKESVDI